MAAQDGYVLFVPINLSTDGDTPVLAGVEGKRIYVVAYTFLTADATIVTFKRDSTVLSGPLDCAANQQVEASYNKDGHFATGNGEALVMNNDSAVVVGGHATVRVGS